MHICLSHSGDVLHVDSATEYSYADAWFVLMAPAGVYASALEVLDIVADDGAMESDPAVHTLSTVCSPGYYAAPFNSTINVTYGSGTADEVVVTPAGSGRCLQCQAGTFTRFAGSSTCSLCSAGSFSAEGASQCSPCPCAEMLLCALT